MAYGYTATAPDFSFIGRAGKQAGEMVKDYATKKIDEKDLGAAYDMLLNNAAEKYKQKTGEQDDLKAKAFAAAHFLRLSSDTADSAIGRWATAETRFNKDLEDIAVSARTKQIQAGVPGETVQLAGRAPISAKEAQAPVPMEPSAPPHYTPLEMQQQAAPPLPYVQGRPSTRLEASKLGGLQMPTASDMPQTAQDVPRETTTAEADRIISEAGLQGNARLEGIRGQMAAKEMAQTPYAPGTPQSVAYRDMMAKGLGGTAEGLVKTMPTEQQLAANKLKAEHDEQMKELNDAKLRLEGIRTKNAAHYNSATNGMVNQYIKALDKQIDALSAQTKTTDITGASHSTPIPGADKIAERAKALADMIEGQFPEDLKPKPMSESDVQAHQWAKSNPTDPRAAKIITTLKQKYPILMR